LQLKVAVRVSFSDALSLVVTFAEMHHVGLRR